ncbi:MAG: magnesium/cobalt transporter CorA [Vicinamibacteria bacterium]|nr:magnesium/cobalt transporter CorA [Vicinamibacteria bacterium]
MAQEDPQSSDCERSEAQRKPASSRTLPRRRKRPSPPVRWIRGLRIPRRFRKSSPGSVAGIEPKELAQMPSGLRPVRITCIDYSADQFQFLEVEDVENFVERHRPDWSAVRWINVDGVTDMRVIQTLAEKYRLHPLAIEDLLHIPQRPKVDAYAEEAGFQARLFIIARMIEMKDGNLHSEQISLFLGHKTVLTFQETPGDVWNPIRQRLQTPLSRLRCGDASFLVYSLLDAIVDHCFPILEHYGDRLEELEDEVLARPDRDVIRVIHRLRRELLLLRRSVWPMRELILRLQRETHECFSDEARTYMRDVYDHTVHIIDIVETYREVATGLGETYMTAMSNHMNEIMKVLTVIGTIFIPLTFLAGVYGMNFRYFPELNWHFSYPLFWIICLVTAGLMLAWFRKQGWL